MRPPLRKESHSLFRVATLISEKGNISSKIKRLCLDSPKLGGVSKKNIRISGWVLAKNPLDLSNIKILVNGGGGFSLNKDRRDVVNKIINDDAERVKQLKCGFSFDFDVSKSINKPLELSLSIDGKTTPWQTFVIEPVEVESDHDPVRVTWERYSTNELDNISTTDAALLEKLKKEEVEKLLFIKSSLVSIKDALLSKAIGKEKSEFKFFLELLGSREFPHVLVSSALSQGACHIPSPFNRNEWSVCSESFNLPNLTVLRFVDSSKEVFFVIQQVTSADLVYFPKRKLAVRIKHASEDILLNVLHLIFSKFSKFLSYSRSASENKFRGIVASFPRPYHFYYEILHGMDLLQKKCVLDRVPEIIYSPGSAFYSFKELYSLTSKENTSDLRLIRDENILSKKFVVQIGVGFSLANTSHVKEIDQFLVSHAIRSIGLKESLGLAEAKKCFPLISFGITIEKRSWLEQADAISSVISFIAQKFPGAGVVFDGWTMPINPTEKDFARVKEFEEFVSLIEKTIPDQVRVFSTIGASSKRKIAFAMLADCFVANSGTDVLHIARFAKKPGVGHNCKGMKSLPEHFAMCPNLRHVDDEYITDIPDEKSDTRGVGFLSYSIKSEVIQEMLLDILAEDVVKNRLNA